MHLIKKWKLLKETLEIIDKKEELQKLQTEIEILKQEKENIINKPDDFKYKQNEIVLCNYSFIGNETNEISSFVMKRLDFLMSHDYYFENVYNENLQAIITLGTDNTQCGNCYINKYIPISNIFQKMNRVDLLKSEYITINEINEAMQYAFEHENELGFENITSKKKVKL